MHLLGQLPLALIRTLGGSLRPLLLLPPPVRCCLSGVLCPATPRCPRCAKVQPPTTTHSPVLVCIHFYCSAFQARAYVPSKSSSGATCLQV